MFLLGGGRSRTDAFFFPVFLHSFRDGWAILLVPHLLLNVSVFSMYHKAQPVITLVCSFARVCVGLTIRRVWKAAAPGRRRRIAVKELVTRRAQREGSSSSVRAACASSEARGGCDEATSGKRVL